jgi:hypothetical protein
MAALTSLVALCVSAGCTSEDPAAPAASAPTAAAPNLMQLAANCHERGGEWRQGQGCGMTEKLCVAIFHGRAKWLQDSGCTIDRGSNASCDHEGAKTTDQFSCSIQYIPIADWRDMK